MLTLLEVELKVDDVLAELETQPDAGESLDELVSAKTEEASLMRERIWRSVPIKAVDEHGFACSS